MLTFFAGLGTGLSLIIAIGAQNAFVLRQGLKKEHVFAVVIFCALSDALLIAMGVAGLGSLIQALPILLEIMRFGGAAYLIWFGLSALKRAIKPGVLSAQGGEAKKLWPTLITAFSLTYLNPHVYLDTVILLGSVANQFDPAQWLFAFGAMAGSLLWFFSLGYGARFLSKYVTKESFWRVLDGIIAFVMFSIAMTLLFGL